MALGRCISPYVAYVSFKNCSNNVVVVVEIWSSDRRQSADKGVILLLDKDKEWIGGDSGPEG